MIKASETGVGLLSPGTDTIVVQGAIVQSIVLLDHSCNLFFHQKLSPRKVSNLILGLSGGMYPHLGSKLENPQKPRDTQFALFKLNTVFSCPNSHNKIGL